ncbi:MAG: HAMP domain-containing protein, partial [Frankia sp.]
MRTRFLTILLTLMAAALATLGLVMARGIADRQQQSMFLERLGDTERLALLAGQAPDPKNADPVLASELIRYDQVHGTRALFVDRAGTVQVSSRRNDNRIDPESRQRLAAALRGQAGQEPRQIWPWQHGPMVVAEPVLSSGAPVGAVVTVSPTGTLRARILRGWLLLGVGELGALVAWVVVAMRLTRWVLGPVRDLDAVAHEMATGQLSARAATETGPPELHRLAVSFNEMADHIEKAVDQQRAVVADASHQLRNPLSALLLRIESMGLGLTPEWIEELEEARAEGRHLTQVLDELLVLARAEHHPARPSTFDVPAVVTERLTAWRPFGDSRGITVRQTGDAHVGAFADRVAFGSALDAVLDNALKFSPPGSSVRVAVDFDRDDVLVRVADGGPGVAPEALATLGRRFW